MSDRMTVAEVVAELRRMAETARIEDNTWCDGNADGLDDAADLVEQHLTPQVLDEQKSRDRETLETLVKSIVLNTRDHEKSTTGKLFFVVSKIRLMAEEVAKLCQIEARDSKSTLPKSPEHAD